MKRNGHIKIYALDKKVIIIIAILILALGGIAMFADSHSCSKRIVTSLDNNVSVEEFEKCVKNNKRGINATYHHTRLGMLLTDNNYYPLHYAVKAGKYEKTKVLLDCGADPNRKDPTVGGTPLEFALSSGKLNRFKIAKLLIEYGADPRIKSDRDDIFSVATIVTVNDTDAVKEESTEFVKEMIIATDYENNREKYRPVILGAAAFGNMKLLEFILETGIDDIDAVSQTGNTALIEAARGNEADACRYLIEAGADKDIKNSEGKTAYDYARQYNYAEIMKLLR